MPSELISAFVSFVTSIATVIVALYLHRRTDQNLEKDRIRRLKVEIVHELLGSRYVFDQGYEASSEEVSRINRALALIPIYFADDKEIISTFDRLKHNKSDDDLIKLLQAAAKSAGVEVLDSAIRRVITIPAKRQAVLHIKPLPNVNVSNGGR